MNDKEILANTQLLAENRFIKLLYDAQNEAIICLPISDLVPTEVFKVFFLLAADEIKAKNAKRMVFDKRSLRLFDQAAMIWYYVELKPLIKVNTGMITYRKILPEDENFRLNVQIGKKFIVQQNPDFQFADYDIQYVETLSDALIN